MGLGRDTRNKILAVSHFQGRVGSDQEYSDLGYSQAQVDVDDDEYAVMDMPQGESGHKLRGLTERKKRRSSGITALPRPQPSNHHSSSSSAGQTSYNPASSQPAYGQGPATYSQGPMQGSPPPMHNSTFNPPSQQYQSGHPNQGYPYANPHHPYQSQGQQHYQPYQQQQQQQQQQPQHYNQGYTPNYNEYTAQAHDPPASQSQPAQPTQQEYWLCNHGYNAIHRPNCPSGCVNYMSRV